MEGKLQEESNVQNLHFSGADCPVKFYNLAIPFLVEHLSEIIFTGPGVDDFPFGIDDDSVSFGKFNHAFSASTLLSAVFIVPTIKRFGGITNLLLE